MSEWISVEDELPELCSRVYMTSMSQKVLVKGEGKNQYPWVAHLHKDWKKYCNYAHGKNVDGARLTWLNPYRDISDGQKVTHWMPLPEPPKEKQQ